MPFEKGKSGNPAGREKGKPNKLTTTVKEKVMETFDRLQDHDKANLYDWATENPTEFYKIAAKLIPTEMKAQVETTVKLPDWFNKDV